jgi:hypothetical protein
MRYQTEPMASFRQVHTTTDYSMFKSIDGNRNKNRLHIARLKQSMLENYLFTVIVVNEKYEIIDGQHRFECIKELKLTLHYIMCKGYGLSEVQRLNANSKTWNADDYLEGYIGMGIQEYILYKEFKEKYDIGHNESMVLLSGKKSQLSGKNAGVNTPRKLFYEGKYKIVSLFDAEDIMDKICLIAPYYTGYKRSAFIHTMIELIKNEHFEFTEFLQKLKMQPTALQDCTTKQQYKMLIEEIYNYKRRDKVNLRFLA